MKIAQICLFALFATAIIAAPVVQTTASDITIPVTHDYTIVEEDNVYLYAEEDNANIYFYYQAFTHDAELLVAFGDPTGPTVQGGLSIVL